MKTIMSLQLVAAFALLTILAAPAFAGQNTQVATAPTQSEQITAPTNQLLVPFKKWWTEN